MTLCLGLAFPIQWKGWENTEKLLHWYNGCTSCKIKCNFRYLRTEFKKGQLDQNRARFFIFSDIYIPLKSAYEVVLAGWQKNTCGNSGLVVYLKLCYCLLGLAIKPKGRARAGSSGTHLTAGTHPSCSSSDAGCVRLCVCVCVCVKEIITIDKGQLSLVLDWRNVYWICQWFFLQVSCFLTPFCFLLW